MSLPFYKFVGAGNDFVFLEYKPPLANLNLSQLSKEICDRHFGIGADGLVAVETLSLLEKKFKWHFFNSDGSSAEMCGNAARCAFQFIHQVYNIKSASIEALCGTLTGEVNESEIKVSWDITSTNLEQLSVDINGKIVEGFFINTGVPHFVLLNQSEKITHNDCHIIQNHSQFAPSKTNVTFLDQSQGTNKTRTFERGVADFTLACGTGVIASAFVLESVNKENIYTLQAPGGSLKVILDNTKVTLIGPAELVFTGKYQLRSYHV